MIKPASLSEELFIVLVPNKENLTPILNIQQAIANHFDLYKGEFYPELHITLNRISKEASQQAEQILTTVCSRNEPIKIIIDSFKCYNLSNKFLALKLNTTTSLSKLATKIHHNLKEEDLSTIENYSDWEFHITIASTNFSGKKLSEDEFTDLCRSLDGLPKKITTTADKIEIWRPTLDPDEKVVASFNLS
ncbi:2'-5' RNA ligase family protein [Natroniella sulfidigena]|uniref:2'-5' RNA ligase family protein n=1 Tax=Natroniella sulfidigena TaxID=723921 RepID=UPI00200A3F10|nr:2'-5' RNA ligase family protein [Natroniella sulfidigena]MCK8816782.1 2'-5' RNA ligase family protein [Natroniella sulfidigena]